MLISFSMSIFNIPTPFRNISFVYESLFLHRSKEPACFLVVRQMDRRFFQLIYSSSRWNNWGYAVLSLSISFLLPVSLSLSLSISATHWICLLQAIIIVVHCFQPNFSFNASYLWNVVQNLINWNIHTPCSHKFSV